MKDKQITKIVLSALIFAGTVFLVSSYFVEQREKDIVSGIKLEIVEQEKTLSNIAEITDRNGADAVVESIIIDCNSSNRQRFEGLLNRLGELNSIELDEIEDLFDACARFYAERKAVMVSRMEREYEVYKSFIDLLKIIDNAISVSEYKISEWERLVVLEKKRSQIFIDQVDVQLEIIKALQNGDKVGSEKITLMLTEANNINEEALVVNQQIDSLRSKLQDI